VGVWFRAGPFGVSSRGRVSARVGPVGVSGGGCDRRRGSGDSALGTLFAVLFTLFAIGYGIYWAALKIWKCAILGGIVHHAWPALRTYGPPVVAGTVLGGAVLFTIGRRHRLNHPRAARSNRRGRLARPGGRAENASTSARLKR